MQIFFELTIYSRLVFHKPISFVFDFWGFKNLSAHQKNFKKLEHYGFQEENKYKEDIHDPKNKFIKRASDNRDHFVWSSGSFASDLEDNN